MKFLPYLLKHLRKNWFRTGAHRARDGGVHLPLLHAAVGARPDQRPPRQHERQAPRDPQLREHRVRPPHRLRPADPVGARCRARGDRELVRGRATREEGGQGRRGRLVLDHGLEQLLPEPGRGARALLRDVPRVPGAPRPVPGAPPGPARLRDRAQARRQVRLEARRHLLPRELHPAPPQARRPLRVRREGHLRHRPREVPRHRHEPDGVQPQVPLRGHGTDAPGGHLLRGDP